MKVKYGFIKSKISNNKCIDWGFLFLALIYRCMLDWAYLALSDSYYEVQFRLNINEIKLVTSYIVVLILCLLTMHGNTSKVFLIRMILFMTIIPNTSVYAMRDGSNFFFIWVTASFAIIEILLLNFKFKWEAGSRQCMIKDRSGLTKKQSGKKNTDQTGMVLNLFLLLFSIITMLFMYSANGLPGTVALNLYKVYEVRSSYQASKYLNYAIALVSTVIVPFGLADGYITRSVWKIVFYSIVQLMLFLWTGNKVFLFTLIIIGVAIIIYKYKLSLNLFFYGITFVVFGGNLSCIFDSKIFSFVFSFVNRRMILDSATLKYFYFDYFIVKRNPILGFGGTILAPFLRSGASSAYRYDLSYRYTGIESNANTGLYGGDLANLGMWAFIVVPILIIILFSLIERTERYCGSEFALLFFVYTVYYLNETCIFLYLLNFTGILLIMIVMFYRYKSGKTEEINAVGAG